MDSSKSTEDDTLRDPAEQGYVATRPRFTRARDTWKVNVRNLVAEDKRALDDFQKNKAKRGGNAFLYPNLLRNGSFEFAAQNDTDLVQGWNLGGPAPQMAVTVATGNTADGAQALQVATVAGQNVAAHSAATVEIDANDLIPCSPGDVYQFAASLNIAPGTLPGYALDVLAALSFFDDNGNLLTTTQGAAAPVAVGWQVYGAQFTVPANAAAMRAQLMVDIANTGAGALALDGSTVVLWDAVGLGLLAPLQLYGRMVGSDCLPRPVRFSKLPEFSDIGMGDGVKRYGANFELTEV